MRESDPITTWAQQHVALRVFRRALEALGSAGIRVLPVKGIVTARRLYEDLTQRPMNDLDLRIAPQSFCRAVRVAETHGWQPDTRAPRLGEATFIVDGWHVEIECTLGPPGLCALSVENILDRATTCVGAFGFPHLEPELHDHALILVLNAFKDGLHGMPWSLEDLRRVVRQNDFKPGVLVERAREGSVSAALWIVANWMAEEHDVAEWATVRDRIGSRPPSTRVISLYAWARRRGWAPKVGLIVAAASSDAPLRCATGFTLSLLGVARRRLLVTLAS